MLFIVCHRLTVSFLTQCSFLCSFQRRCQLKTRSRNIRLLNLQFYMQNIWISSIRRYSVSCALIDLVWFVWFQLSGGPAVKVRDRVDILSTSKFQMLPTVFLLALVNVLVSAAYSATLQIVLFIIRFFAHSSVSHVNSLFCLSSQCLARMSSVAYLSSEIQLPWILELTFLLNLLIIYQ